MKYLTLIFIHLFTLHVHAETSLVSQDTVFLQSKSPYTINSNITVKEGVTVTIEEGAKLIFNQGGLFLNKAKLTGKGFSIESKTSDSNFLIQCNACEMNLEDVSVTGVPRSVISAWNSSDINVHNINIDFDTYGSQTIGVQVFNQTKLTVDNSSFKRLYKAFDIFTLSTTTITDSVFEYNDYGIYTFDSSLKIHRNDFELNHIALEYFRNPEVFVSVDASNNWWGTGSSPIVKEYADQADVNVIVGPALYIPWSTSPYKTEEPQNGMSNVLFLPGLMGSRLYQKEVLENQLWEPNRNKDVTKLFLNTEGKSIIQNIYTRDILAKTNLAGGVPAIDQSLYKEFAEHMDSLVQKGDMQSWKSSPYDWRYSPDMILQDGIMKGNVTVHLIDEVKQLAKTSKTKKVTLITHSNGGLIAKQLMIELKKQKLETLVDGVIFVAMPEYGTPQAITALLYGHEQAMAGGLILKASVAQKLGINMPSAYSLLPSALYMSQDVQSYLSEGQYINNSLLQKAKDLHVVLDAWIPPQQTSVYQIIGTGVLTVSGLMKDSKGSYVPAYSNSGDGTVQDMYNNTTHTFFRTGKVLSVNLSNSKFKHTNIMNHVKTLEYIDTLLNKNVQNTSYNKPQEDYALYRFTGSSTPLSLKTLIFDADSLKYNPQEQFNFVKSENMDGRFDLFGNSIQYITNNPVREFSVTEHSGDTFDLSILIKKGEVIDEMIYEDIMLFPNSVLTFDSDLKINNTIIVPVSQQVLYTGATTTIIKQQSAEDFNEKILRVKNSIKTSNMTGYLKDRYIRRLDGVLQKKNLEGLTQLKKNLEGGVRAISTFSNNPALRQRYAKLKEDYIYLIYLLR
ncbi:MAG: hypothetical protein V4686_01775 [Patescibacteria group bacterium]